MEMHHRPGRKHVNADSLSRPKVESDCQRYEHNVRPEDLPCDGCRYCQKRHEEWGQFIDEVDEAISLAWPVPSVQSVVTDAKVTMWVQNHSWNDIKGAQRRDANLKLILAWLENQEKPTESELMLRSPAAKHYWVNKELCLFDDGGFLWKRDETKLSTKLLVVPSESTRNHRTPGSGQNRRNEPCKTKFYWYHMSRDLKNFVISCAVCNRNKKPNRRARARLISSHLNFMGPFPVTKNGNTCILMMVDQFTKWVVAKPIRRDNSHYSSRPLLFKIRVPFSDIHGP